MIVSDNYIFVVNNDLHILDIKDSSNPLEVGSYITPFYEEGTAVYLLGEYIIQIFNSNGEEIISKTKTKENIFEVDLLSLNEGLYYIIIISDDYLITDKLIITK
jgi:hypothetical protein